MLAQYKIHIDSLKIWTQEVEFSSNKNDRHTTSSCFNKTLIPIPWNSSKMEEALINSAIDIAIIR